MHFQRFGESLRHVQDYLGNRKRFSAPNMGSNASNAGGNMPNMGSKAPSMGGNMPNMGGNAPNAGGNMPIMGSNNWK